MVGAWINLQDMLLLLLLVPGPAVGNESSGLPMLP